jgi:serine/threonine protein kinase
MGTNPQYAEGDVIANKYVVESPLGESAAGYVYLATGNFGSQKLVVKFYRAEVSTRLLAAPDFFLKAASMTELEHDNICSSLDVQEEMGLVFVARAFADGQSFEEWLSKARSDANYFSKGLELLWQVSQGLIALHDRTRHLNIHPGNVIVGNMVAKLCDWDPRALTSSEMTPEPLPLQPKYRGYRAPEVAGNGSFLSYPSTDLFAIAGLLYRLIKGDHPSPQLAQTQQEIRGFDKDIAIFLAKAMHPKPEERFQEASAFSDALWDLKPAMQRLQDRNTGHHQSNPPELKDRKSVQAPSQNVDSFFPPPSSASDFDSVFPGKEPTLMGLAKKPSKDDDSFFQFFPPPEESPTQDPFGQPKANGDTLFGSPPLTTTPKSPVYQAPPQDYSHKPKSGLESLESSGTLFGNSAPLFSSAPTPKSVPNNKPRPKPETVNSQPIKPLAVSLSSLEKDPLDMAGGNSTAGFTQFGFKGAGENRTGIFTPEQKAASAKTKLMIILAAVGGLILILGLGGLFLFLRETAAPKVVEPEAIPPATEEQPLAANRQDSPPYEITADPKDEQALPPAPQTTVVTPPPTKAITTPVNQAVEPPQPKIEPPIQPHSDASNNEILEEGNGKGSSQRLAELMAMVQTRTWPAKASQRLQAANELNDLGKTAEANMAYGKALAAGDATEKQKVSALGGLAVTFQVMGMNDQAKDAVDRILEINPRNAFALKLKEKLK